MDLTEGSHMLQAPDGIWQRIHVRYGPYTAAVEENRQKEARVREESKGEDTGRGKEKASGSTNKASYDRDDKHSSDWSKGTTPSTPGDGYGDQHCFSTYLSEKCAALPSGAERRVDIYIGEDTGISPLSTGIDQYQILGKNRVDKVARSSPISYLLEARDQEMEETIGDKCATRTGGVVCMCRFRGTLLNH